MPQSHPWATRPQRAFTLIEIAVVVVILGILIALTLPGYRRVNLKTRATAVMNDFRTFSGAFSAFNLQNSRWPTDTGVPGAVPPELANGFSVAFTKTSPIGGKYLWISNSTYKAAIAITTDGSDQLTTDVELLELVDQLMDDGNTSAGNVQVVGPALIYIIEQ